MFTHGKRVQVQPKKVVVEKKPVEPSPVKEKPVIVPKKEIKRKKSTLEELLEEKE